jgi:Phosphoesterase family
VRVPAILVSPYVKKGVDHTLFDHTSVLKYLIDKWSLGPLGERTRNANNIKDLLQSTPASADRLAQIPALSASNLPPPNYGQILGRRQPVLNAHQSALVGMTQLLESMSTVAADSLLGRTKRLITGFDGVVDVAMERVADFFSQNKPPAA